MILQGETISSLSRKETFDKRSPSWSTIWNWLLTIGTMFLRSYSKQFPKVSRHRAWQTDETFILDEAIIGTVDPQTNQIFLTCSNNTKKETILNHLLRLMTRWNKIPRALWTDGHASYPPALDLISHHIPHGTVNHSQWEFKNKLNQTTNAIENVWRQLKHWLYKRNGLKKPEYLHLHVQLFQASYTQVKTPLQMAKILLQEQKHTPYTNNHTFLNTTSFHPKPTNLNLNLKHQKLNHLYSKQASHYRDTAGREKIIKLFIESFFAIEELKKYFKEENITLKNILNPKFIIKFVSKTRYLHFFNDRPHRRCFKLISFLVFVEYVFLKSKYLIFNAQFKSSTFGVIVGETVNLIYNFAYIQL